MSVCLCAGVVFQYRGGIRLLPTLPSRPRPSLLSLLLARSAILPLLLLGPPLLLIPLVLLVLVLRVLLPSRPLLLLLAPRTRVLETDKKKSARDSWPGKRAPENRTRVSAFRFARCR